MGIYDRDYMRRSPEDQRSGRDRPAADRLEEFFERGWRRHKRLLKLLGLVLAGVVLFALIRLKFGP